MKKIIGIKKTYLLSDYRYQPQQCKPSQKMLRKAGSTLRNPRSRKNEKSLAGCVLGVSARLRVLGRRYRRRYLLA